MAGRHRMFDADSAPQWDDTAQKQIAALRGEPLGAETMDSFRRKAARDGGWSLGLTSSRLVYRYCFGARVWKSFGRGCDLKDAEAAGRWMKTGEYAELHDRAVAHRKDAQIRKLKRAAQQGRPYDPKPGVRSVTTDADDLPPPLPTDPTPSSVSNGSERGLPARPRTAQRVKRPRTQSKPQLTLAALAKHDGAGGGASLSRTDSATLAALAEHDGAGGGASLSRTDSATETHTGDSPRAPTTRSASQVWNAAERIDRELDRMHYDQAPWVGDGTVPLEDQVSGVGVYGPTSLQAFRPEQQMDGFVATRWHERGWDLQLRRQGVDVASVRDMSDGRSSIMASGKRTTYTGGRRGHE